MGDEWRMWFWCLFLPSTKKCDNFDENCRLSIAQTVSNTYINHGVAMVLLAKSNILPRSLRCFRKPVIPFDSAGGTPQQPSISFRHELENTHFFLACWNWGCDMMEDKTSITNKYIQICTFDFVSPKNMEIRSCWTPFVCFQSVPFSHFFHRICTRGSSGGVLGLSQDHGGWDQDRARDALWSQGRWTLGLSQLS